MAGSLVGTSAAAALLCLLTAALGDLHPTSHQTSTLSAYEVTIPRQLTEREKQAAGPASSPQDSLSYIIQIGGRDHVIHLTRNKDFIVKDFTVFTYGDDGNLVSSRPDVQSHCHFQGFVEGVDHSMVTVSTCDGLRGLLHTSKTHVIEPLENSSTFQHLVYQMEDILEKPLACGVSNETGFMPQNDHEGTEQHLHDGHSLTSLLRYKRAILPQTRYIELFLVWDKELYDAIKNETAVREQAVQLANCLDGIYRTLNIRVVLVGLEIWTNGNQISIEGGAGEVLTRFVQWREKDLLPRRRHDSGQLILFQYLVTSEDEDKAVVGELVTNEEDYFCYDSPVYRWKNFTCVVQTRACCLSLPLVPQWGFRKKRFGGVVGMAFVSTICTGSYSGGINVYHSKIPQFASIVAHELGHNLGMSHDNGRNCRCEAESCVMNSGASNAVNFSSCSADDFEAMIMNKGGSCLLNVPRPEEEYSPPFCGNKLVDSGEECDCGSPEECKNDLCCEASTCKLKYGAECATGVCCRRCRFLPAGTVCRASVNECDLPEYCNGTSHNCQADVFVQNGHPCQHNSSYCYNGVCQSYDSQCVALFGQSARSAPHKCFQEVNSKGDRFGNCGTSGASYRKCEIRNSMCGKLQCENVKSKPVFGILPSIIQTPIGGTTCWGVDFRMGSDVPDPGMVNPGTRCDAGKVCMNFKCVDVSILNYDCDVEVKCNGHGVCNNNKNCHCAKGWAPPDCVKTGYGGSIDSGPTYNDKDTSLRDGLLIFFLLVVPLIILLVYMFIKRNALKRKFYQTRSSQRHKSESTAGPRNAPNNLAKEGERFKSEIKTENTRKRAPSVEGETEIMFGVVPTRTAVPTYVDRPPRLSPSRPAPTRPVPSRPVHPPQRV